MSSTNTGHGGHAVPDDHGGLSGPPPQEVIDRGYEADAYDARTVLSVPLLVILFFVLAFGTVTIIFGIIAYPKANPKEHPGAVQKNKRPLNERMADNDRGPKHGEGQPRLEPLRLRSGESRAITRPELPEGNSPEIHPEDIRATKERFPTLYNTGPQQLGIDKTMSLSQEELKHLFPVQKGGSPVISSQHLPTNANAGRGADESMVVVPPLPQPPAQVPPPKPKGGKP